MDLNTVSTEELVEELQKRFKALQKAKDMLFNLSDEEHSAKKTSNKSAEAARDRWSGWSEYKLKNKTATPKQFFKAKREGKL